MRHMDRVICGSCKKEFRSNRRPLDKFCSRGCYLAARASKKAKNAESKNAKTLIRVPAKFFDDHEERECEPFCSPAKRSERFVWLCRGDAGLDELLDDAKHYADDNGGPFGYEGCSALRRSAAATVKAIEQARVAC